MASEEKLELSELIYLIEEALEAGNLNDLAKVVKKLKSSQLISVIERLNDTDRAIVFRVLPKALALEVFESLATSLQSELIEELSSEEVSAIFSKLDPDDRVGLLDELPASVAQLLLTGLSAKERNLTGEVLGYPQGSIGRRMSPEYVAVKGSDSVSQAITKVKGKLQNAETIYTLPVIDLAKQLIGVVSLRDLLKAPPRTKVSKIMLEPHMVKD